MGNWCITIQGVGCHHNCDVPSDADVMAAQFVKVLREAGHRITHATITYGGESDLSQPTTYLDDRSSSTGARCGKSNMSNWEQEYSMPTFWTCTLVQNHEGPCKL